MEFEVRKTENCFVNSETYEYSLPIGAEEFLKLIEDDYSVRLNTRLRRPVFIAESEDIKIKAVLKSQKIRVSFSEERWESLKEEFEAFLNFSDS
ncbi:MAG: hypothetical protein GYA88_02690 [Clostridiales bacterium]|nr:hypothetical protein [Clostridiales bacterium]